MASLDAEAEAARAGDGASLTMRDDRTVLISILDRHDSSIDALSAELLALKSQLDQFRDEVRERLTRIEQAVLQR
jgi:hypothetical protein